MKTQIAEARPDILIVAATMPLGELWLSAHLADLGVPVGVNLGAALDFAAGRISRAPRWMRKRGSSGRSGSFLSQKLFPRYARNAWFIFRMALWDQGKAPAQSPDLSPTPSGRGADHAESDSMIISQTPYRVSFAGGGTDLPAFYRQDYGAVLSTTIDHHMYVTIHKRFESSIRVSYSRTETASTVDQVQHELVREAMREVESTSRWKSPRLASAGRDRDGSSSSLTVGLLNALHAYRNRVASPRMLAEGACRIEIDVLKKPIGRQDQYAVAYGGMNYIRFNSDDTVDVEPVPCRPELLSELEDRTLLLYMGQTRDANTILSGSLRARPTPWRSFARCATWPPRCGCVCGRGSTSPVRDASARGLGAGALAWLRHQQRRDQPVV